MILATGATRQIRKTNRLINLMLLGFLLTSSPAHCTEKKPNNTSTNKKQQQTNTNVMKKVLIIGMDPHTIDFTNPEIPQGLTIEKIEKGANATLEKLNSMGYDAELFLIKTGDNDLGDLTEHLHHGSFDGVVIGNGIRGLKTNFILFEKIINVVHTHAPKSKIIFNSLPTDTDEAVKRWL